MNKNASASNFMTNTGLKKQPQKRRKSSHEFLQKLISVEQNFSVFRYSDQGRTENNTASSTFYPQQISQVENVTRVDPPRVQNTQMLSNLYLLPQCIGNKKAQFENQQKKQNRLIENRQRIGNNSLLIENNGKIVELSDKYLVNNQNNHSYQVLIPQLSGVQGRNSFKKMNLNFSNDIYQQNQRQKSLYQQISQENQKLTQFPQTQAQIVQKFKDKKIKQDISDKLQLSAFQNNNGFEEDTHYQHQKITDNQKQNELKTRNRSESKSVEILKDEDQYFQCQNSFLNRGESFQKLQSKEQTNSNEEIKNKLEESQHKFNELIRSFRYGKIKEHQMKIFRQMKNNSIDTNNVYQFHNQSQPDQKNGYQDDQNHKLQYRSPLQKSKSPNQSIRTFYTIKQENSQQLMGEQVTAKGDKLMRQIILQKKKSQYKQDCENQTFQNFFKKLVTLDKALKPNTVTSNKEPNEVPKECLSEIQAISKQLNGNNPIIYNPFNAQYYKEKHIFSKKLEGRQNEENNISQNNCIQEQNTQQDQNNQQQQQEQSKSQGKSLSIIPKIQNKINFFKNGNTQSLNQQNKNKDVASLLCKYINSNRNYLSYEPHNLLKKPHSKMSTPINLESYQLLQKFLPNFNSVERHFAYSESNLQKNQLVLEKVLLERIIKQQEGIEAQNLEEEINKKSDLLVQPITKNGSVSANRNLQFPIF